MFKTENVEVYVKGVTTGLGKDDVILATLTLYVTPIKYELAKEVDESLAATLFRKRGTEYKPVQILDKPTFLLEPQGCSLKWRTLPDMDSGGGLIPFVQFTKLRAFKPFADNPNFTLAFDATFICPDKDTLWSFAGKSKKSIFVTFTQVQGELFPDLSQHDGKLCRLCDAPNPEFMSVDGEFYYCAKHESSAPQEEERPRRIRPAIHEVVEALNEADVPNDAPNRASKKKPDAKKKTKAKKASK